MGRRRRKRIKKNFLKGSVIFVVLYAIVFIPYYYYNTEFIDLTDSNRINASGNFKYLKDGYTHYQETGNRDSATVILVHGFSVPSYIWDITFKALADSGFNVISYDLFGRGYSDRPVVDYSYIFFANQLNELKNSLQIYKKVHLVGLSMGGAVVATYGNMYADQVQSITLIDPTAVRRETIGFLSWPVLGDYLMVFNILDYPNNQMTDFYKPENYPNWTIKYETQMRYNGFRQAILSTLRKNYDTDYSTLYTILSLKGIPIQIIWGIHDETVPFSISKNVKKMIPLAKFYAIPEAGHLPHIEQSDTVNFILSNFIYQN